MKLYDSEMKKMELIWKNEPVSAKELSLLAQNDIGWNKNTTYTVIKKVIEKGYVKMTTVSTILFAVLVAAIAYFLLTNAY